MREKRQPLTAERSGFYDLRFHGKPFQFQRSYGTYIMQSVLFKIGYPTAFHGQSAVESAIRLHPLVKHRLNDIKRVEVRCHRAAMTIMNKTGPLRNPADRDHCMQYIIAVGMIFGTISAQDYEDSKAADSRIDALRAKMKLVEYARYERDYHDTLKHSNASSIQVFFKDGGKTPLFEVEYPLGHRRRRQEGLPLLMQKFETNVARVFAAKQRDGILAACLDQRRLESMPVNEFVDLMVF